ncbi:MAG: LysM peptidoglycan-binding domain-containing protein [Sulfurimonas sp.]|nr:LysM peptidoglycan-binding domain-containing protein [Sulfurimonas sp.]MDD3059455.1 LysM peptidoglycan-binding domain-containing protein [Sulfurimonas sp.]MDD5202618.1 LysM peptidoglycan-binding domain-containing protein [Sulfurimonas sp.]
MRYFFILLLPIFLYANLAYGSNYNKELAILESLNIDPSFIYDPIMNEMRETKSEVGADQYFIKRMDDASPFVPTIKNILAKNNVPQEFLYLAMAESNFANESSSAKRASGIWQFMPATAKKFNLKIDEYVDERQDFVKSTEAASKYLTKLYGQFGKWYLAAIAYNCGSGRLSKAIEKAGTDDLAVLLDKDEKYIPKESRIYIRKIVALSLIGNDEEFLLKNECEYLLNSSCAFPVSTIKVSRGESLQRLSEVIDVPLADLQKLNRHLKHDFVPPSINNYTIHIPYEKLAEFNQNYTQKPIENTYKHHVVGKGDSLLYLSKMYGVSTKEIMEFNHLKTSALKIKQTLIMPVPNTQAFKKVPKKLFHTVQKGDSLVSIAKAHKVSVQDIKAKNNLRGDMLKIGDKLEIYE